MFYTHAFGGGDLKYKSPEMLPKCILKNVLQIKNTIVLKSGIIFLKKPAGQHYNLPLENSKLYMFDILSHRNFLSWAIS